MKNLLLCLCLLLGVSACVDLADLSDAKVPDYQAEFAVPLINSRVTIKDMLDSNESLDGLMIDPDGTLRFQYEGTEIRREGPEAFAQLTADFPPAFPVLLPENRYPLNLINNLELDRLDFKSGGFTYYLENPNLQRITVEFEFTSLLKDGEPLRFTIEVPAFSGSGNLPAGSNADGPIDLSGYQLLPDDNEVVLRYSATNENGQDVPVTNFLVRLVDPAFSYAEGYLGQFLIEGVEDSVAIDFYEEYTDGSISFADPKAILEVENSFGVPTRAQVNEFVVITEAGQEKEVNSSLIDAGLDFAYPGLNDVGTVVRESFVFDRNNSNIVSLFEDNPVSMIYDVDALVNPDEDENLRGFITDSSFYSLQLLVELPLYGTASEYLTRDTSNFDLGDVSNIDRASFKIITENELGVDVEVQAYFLDDQGAVLETLFADRTLIAQGAPVDAEGRTSTPAVTTTFVETDAVRTQRIQEASQLVLEVGFSTQTNAPQAVRILEDQGVRVKMGAILSVQND